MYHEARRPPTVPSKKIFKNVVEYKMYWHVRDSLGVVLYATLQLTAGGAWLLRFTGGMNNANTIFGIQLKQKEALKPRYWVHQPPYQSSMGDTPALSLFCDERRESSYFKVRQAD
jgi:hypothetical protein